MKTLGIEWQRLLDGQQKTCPRCGSTEEGVENAVRSLKKELAAYGIDVTLRKKAIDPATFRKDALQSNKITIEGKTLEEWLGAATGQSKCCEACGDAECRTVEYGGLSHEAIPADLIVKAGRIAVSQVFHVKLADREEKRTAVKLLSKGCC
jgi:hypothetical protein